MKNVYEVRGEVTAIIINSPKYGYIETLISTNKLKKADEFKHTWYASFAKNTKTFYVHGTICLKNGKHKTIKLHRWITDPPSHLFIDHIDGDTLNNADSNLRLATCSENGQNRRGANSDSSSGILGVCWCKKNRKCNVQIRLSGKNINVGYYVDVIKAEQAFIEAKKKYHPFSREA